MQLGIAIKGWIQLCMSTHLVIKAGSDRLQRRSHDRFSLSFMLEEEEDIQDIQSMVDDQETSIK